MEILMKAASIHMGAFIDGIYIYFMMQLCLEVAGREPENYVRYS
jgi:hypothetical protein